MFSNEEAYKNFSSVMADVSYFVHSKIILNTYVEFTKTVQMSYLLYFLAEFGIR